MPPRRELKSRGWTFTLFPEEGMTDVEASTKLKKWGKEITLISCVYLVMQMVGYQTWMF